MESTIFRPNAQTIYFPEKPLIQFSCTSAPFVMQNFKKSLEWIQSCEVVLFSSQNDPLAPNENFYQENHIYKFHILLDPSHCAKLQKKILRVDLKL